MCAGSVYAVPIHMLVLASTCTYSTCYYPSLVKEGNSWLEDWFPEKFSGARGGGGL